MLVIPMPAICMIAMESAALHDDNVTVMQQSVIPMIASSNINNI